MPNFDWRGIVRAVAPALGTALGGPLAGMATRALSDALLGRPDGSEGDIAEAMQSAGPDALLRLKEADHNFTLRMRELDIDLERIAAQDRDSARGRETRTGDVWTPRVIAALVLLGFLWCVAMVLTGEVRGLSDPVIVGFVGTLVGYVSAKADQVVSYYFGSSAGSADKTRAMENAMRGNK